MLKENDDGSAIHYLSNLLNKLILICFIHTLCHSGPGCSKLTMSLVNVSLKFQTLISQICQYCLLKKCEKLLQCKSFSHFFQQKNSVYLVIKL